ncbi:MAG TPA: cupredoxin domain-containing protein [Actinomycetota bacterium]|jgi:plastocyanin|nr:cupredoxin domain-containing protein [Actinomycetota bacterium]
MRWVAVALAVFALSGLGAACSTGSGAAPSCDTPTTTDEVDMQGLAFTPACVSATANDTLQLINKDSAEHTYTVKGTSINVTIDGGQTASAPLTGIAPGTYSVTCQIHPQMKQTLQIT